MVKLPTFLQRVEYLRIQGVVGVETFGFDRYLNQAFYKSREWRDLRNYIIARDNGCDLGVEGHDIHGRILIHHINPIAESDILNREEVIFDPNNLVTTTHRTHNAIHFGSESLEVFEYKPRTPNDTTLW